MTWLAKLTRKWLEAPKAPSPPATLGTLEAAVAFPESATAVFVGWCGSYKGPVTGHRVMLDGKELPIKSVQWGMPSEDVGRFFPNLVDVNACRFRVDATLPPGFDPQAFHLASHEALYTTGPGRRYFQFWNSPIPLPSPELAATVGGNFVPIAGDLLSLSVEFLHLQPHHSILDVSCGIGRLAYGVAGYLGPDGRYEGFDIAREMIEWAQGAITPFYPNIRFQVADVFNAHYNPAGRSTAEQYVFPFADQSFDAVVLTSVFTHMHDAGVDNYLSEIARVLKPGGRCLATAFLLDDVARANMARGNANFQFTIQYGKFWTADAKTPENAVAIDAALFSRMVRRNGLRIERQHPGTWSAQQHPVTLQDLVILRR